MPPLRVSRIPDPGSPIPDPCVIPPSTTSVHSSTPRFHGRRSQRQLPRLASTALCAVQARNQIGSLARSCIVCYSDSVWPRRRCNRFARSRRGSSGKKRSMRAAMFARWSKRQSRRTRRSARATMCERSTCQGRSCTKCHSRWSVDGRFLRGTVDCLVQTASDRFTVLEFKTGQERSEHRAQIDLYQRAMQQVFPDCKVDARLIYAGAP